jgi:threonine dehydratase
MGDPPKAFLPLKKGGREGFLGRPFQKGKALRPRTPGFDAGEEKKGKRKKNLPQKYLKKILNARVYDVARETSLDYAPVLSQRLRNRVWLKREDEQPVFSFKCRGAYNKMAGLPSADLKKGVIAASAGNHAQGVALAARKLGTHAVIVMPRTTPQIKVDAVRNLGGRVILHGDNYDAAYDQARELEGRRRLTFVHPYDDPEVIAGQGTIGFEILKQHTGGLHAVFVPVGGGGLIAGIAVYIKQLRPDTRIIGVEPEDADAMDRSLKTGRRVRLDHVGIFAEGVAVRQVGEETYRLCKEFVDEIVIVTNDEICAAIKDIFEDRRSVLEPAGALAFAGLKRYAERGRLRNQELIAIASGANVNFDRLRHVAERAEIGERRRPSWHRPSRSGRAASSDFAPSSGISMLPSSTTATPTRIRPTFSWASRFAGNRRSAG